MFIISIRIEMTEIVLSKQQKQWNKQLSQHLQRYASLRDWSQLAAWLSRLKNHISQRKGQVIEINTLLKRLATSLNGTLPVALHEATLQIYELIFASGIILGQQLHTACIGLFSFYAMANVKNKSKLNQIFIKHFPIYGPDLKILAAGLSVTILPSLNQMHEGLQRQVNNLLDLLSRPDLVGQQMLAEAVWVAILRSPVCRVAGLKFISSKLGKGAHEQDHDEQDTFWNQTNTKHMQQLPSVLQANSIKKQQSSSQSNIKNQIKNQGKDLLSEWCPNLQKLVINSLIICIEDTNVLAIKAGLDFLYKYLPLKNEMVSDQAKLRIAKSVVWLLGKRDTSVTRKINLWLFGKPDDQNHYQVNQKQLAYVIQALVGFLRKQSSIEPIKIAFNLLTQHDQMPSLVLRQIVPDLMEFCQKQQSNSQAQKEAIKQLNRLIQRIKPHLSIFLTSLSRNLLNAISQKRFDLAQKTLDQVVFFVNKILKTEQQDEMVKPTLRLLLQSSVLTRWQQKNFMKQSLRQILQLIQKNKDALKKINIDKEDQFFLIEHNKIFKQLIDHVGQKQQLQRFEQQIWLINRILVRFQQIFGISSQQWVNNILKNIALNDPQHFIAPIQVLGQAMEKDGLIKKQILLRSEQQSKNNCIRVCMSKLWGILSLGHLQSRVIPLLLRFVKHFTGFFERLLLQQFQSGELAIIKFRLFWQVAPKYPTIMGSQQVDQVTRFGLFRMLEFLDSSNPLVKYHSNIWINQTYPNFNRVLNPMLQIMLKPKDFWYRTPQGQYVYAVVPQTQKLINILGHLKSFIRLVPQKFNKFAFKPLTLKIMPYYRIFKGQDPGKQGVQVPYLGVILQLIVRYTQTKMVGGDNMGLDLAACQVLECIVKSASSQQLSNYLLKYHFRGILRALHFATINQQHLLQIQLLQLLKLMVRQSGIRSLGDSKILKETVGQSNLVNILLEGVRSDFPYIKHRFVQFLNQCIPLLMEHHPACGQAISLVFNTYTTKIAYVNSKKVEASSQKDLQISQKNAQILILFEGIKELLSHFLNLHPKPFQKQKFQHDTQAGQFSFYSLKAEINLKLQKHQGSKNRKTQQQIGKQLIIQLPTLVAIMASCWTISEMKSHYLITQQGISAFDYTVFLQSYNPVLKKARDKLETQQTVESFIVNLLRVLLNKYPSDTIRALATCWSSGAKDMQTRLKVLQLLIFSGIPLQQFYQLISETLNPDRIGRRKRTGGFQLQKNSQQDILFLCHCFSQYNFQSNNYSHNLIQVWLAFVRTLKIFENTVNPLTLFSVLQLVHLFLVKNNPKQIIRQQKLKKDIAHLLNFHQDLLALLTGKTKIESTGNWRFKSLFPLPSTVKQLRDSSNCPNYLNLDQIPTTKINQVLRLIGLTVAQRISYSYLASLSGGQNQIVLVRRIRQMAVAVLGLVEQKQGSSWLVQASSELILGLLEQKRHLLVKQLKNQILHIFNKEDFFICSSRTLQSWAKIIDTIIDNNKDHDIFQQYLQKVSLASSLFSSISVQTKKKIKSFERICFILYAGNKDKYTQKAQLLVDKIIEVIKNADAPQPVLILVFFCIRILILRVSPQKLTKLLSSLWGMIIFLLSNIFSETPAKDRLNLHWAALKLVEMISLMQIAQFHIHQWTFFYDLVGLQFNSSENPSSQITLNIHPKIHKFLPKDIKIVKEQQWPEVKEGRLIIKQDKIDDIELLKTKTLALSNYLVASNGCLIKFDMRQVEELINSDFLNLDEFIFKVK